MGSLPVAQRSLSCSEAAQRDLNWQQWQIPLRNGSQSTEPVLEQWGFQYPLGSAPARTFRTSLEAAKHCTECVGRCSLNLAAAVQGCFAPLSNVSLQG